MRHRAVAITFAVITFAMTVSPAAAAELPVVYNGILGYAHASPTASPPGANNWSCKPSAAHPVPVILVHGTFGDMSDSWQALSPLLYDNGYCVFALNYGSYDGSGSLGVYATGDIAQSAQQLSTFVNKVLAATGAKKVDLVGHSQGGMMPRYYIKFLGGASKVDTLVGLAPSNHGTTLNGLFTLASYFPGASSLVDADCPACQEQEAGSSFITQPERRRRDCAGGELHGDRVRQRRGRDAVHLGIPGAGAERHEHPPPEPVLARPGRAPVDALRPHRRRRRADRARSRPSAASAVHPGTAGIRRLSAGAGLGRMSAGDRQRS